MYTTGFSETQVGLMVSRRALQSCVSSLAFGRTQPLRALSIHQAREEVLQLVIVKVLGHVIRSRLHFGGSRALTDEGCISILIQC
jgi:hypothetical protein